MLDSDASCHDQQVFNNSTVYLCFKKPGTKDEFENLTEVAPGQTFEYAFSGHARKADGTKPGAGAGAGANDEWSLFL